MKALLGGLRHRLRVAWLNARHVLRLQCDWIVHRPGRHPPGAEVTVSVTSYPPRFPTLHLTLKSLLIQSERPARVVLWIADTDRHLLPPAVTRLSNRGLDIRFCEDLRSYKKLVPELRERPGSTVVTADDDVYYPRDWLAALLCAYRANRTDRRNEVLCHRMHRMRLGDDGLPLPYTQWEHTSDRVDASALHFPTGIGGVLYPAGILGDDVLDVNTFTELCPRGDDIWFYWMARSNGAVFRRVPGIADFHTWDGSQDAALWKENVHGAQNDVQIGRMIDRYGFFGVHRPAREPVPAP